MATRVARPAWPGRLAAALGVGLALAGCVTQPAGPPKNLQRPPPVAALAPSTTGTFAAMEAAIAPASHGYLKHWAEQGVLLLNNCLTVEAGMAASHQGKGWEKFTDAAVAAVAADPAPKVFILWGSHAQRKAANVPGLGAGSPHLILRAPHPSPLSAHNGFFGSKPFSQANAFLEAHGRGSIDWRLPDNPEAPAA